MMDNLPVELVVKILNNLNLKSKLRLRLLSKRYKSIIDNLINFKELIICENKRISTFSDYLSDDFRMVKWFDNHKFMDLNNFIVLNKSNSNYFISILNDQHFKNIQKLYIQQIPDNMLNFVAKFNRLDCLYINFQYDGPITKSHTSHPLLIENKNLTKLKLYSSAINYNYSDSCYFYFFHRRTIINCLNLKSLYSAQFNNFKFLHPNSVTFLSTDDYFHSLLNISDFPELKIREYKFFLIDSTLKNYLIFFSEFEKHKNIKRIIIYIKGLQYDKELFTRFINYYLNSNLKNRIQLFINGIQVKDNFFISDYYQNRYLNDEYLSICLDNYSCLLSSLPEIRSMNYSAYESKLLENKIPHCFLNKLTNLNEISIIKPIENQNKFFKLLFDLNQINTLNIHRGTLLKNDFYFNLYKYMPNLVELNINDNNYELIDSLDLNFLLNFKYLEIFEIERELDLNLIGNLFVNLVYLLELKYLSNDKNTLICVNIERDCYLDSIINETKQKIKTTELNLKLSCSSLEETLNLIFSYNSKNRLIGRSDAIGDKELFEPVFEESDGEIKLEILASNKNFLSYDEEEKKLYAFRSKVIKSFLSLINLN